MQKYSGHIIGTTACLGGELGTLVSDMQKCEAVNDMNNAQIYHNQIIDFILMCKEIFNEDFYLECAPAASKDQILVNQRLLKISEAFNLKMCIGSDAHYLTKDDRYVHKAYLNSKNGEREIDSFYEYTYLMSAEEARENLKASFSDDVIDWIFSCSLDMKNSIQDYSLFQYQAITEVPVKDYPREAWWGVNNDYADEMNNYPTLKSMFTSDNQQERYWVNQCWESLEKKTGKIWIDNLEYINRLEEEAKTKRIIGEKLHTNMFA
jgi:DNA polymerase-3 subunit alpha